MATAKFSITFTIQKTFEIPYNEKDDDLQAESENEFITKVAKELEAAGWSTCLETCDLKPPKTRKVKKTRRK